MATPVTLEDARRQLRMEADDTSRDDDLKTFIADAAAWVENYTGQILDARDITETFRGLGPVALRAWPIKPDAVPAVAYIDVTNTPIALTGARLDLTRRPARVLPPSQFWPFRDAQQLFTVTIRAGYEADEAAPGTIRRAMLVLIGAYDGDREGGDILAKAEDAARRICGDLRGNRL
ncbi:MAG: phage head-tail connector protein [Sphingomonas phyllosphaerae]|uniref:phage head-tail connector protein n=1 Tax=Sphingomonas phyllosphaerae TaxID=257003 RepID=UPI002FF79286